MAYNPIPTYVTNQQITAAHGNTYWKDNFAALFPYTTIGDIAYASAANVLSKLGIGSAGQILKVNAGATAPEWGINAGVIKRQGGSATDWWNYGTNNYVPSSSKIQVGVSRFTFSSSSAVNVAVTFPEEFAHIPIILMGPPRLVSGSYTGIPAVINTSLPSVSAVTLWLYFASAQTCVFDCGWLAIGD